MPHAGGLVDKVCTRRLELLVVARHDRRMEDLSASVLGAQRSAQCLVRRCGAVRCGAVQRRAEQSRAVQHAKAQRGTCNVQHATRNMQGATAAWYLVGSEVQLGTKVLLHKTAHHLPCRTCRYDKTACCTLCALRRCMQAHSWFRMLYRTLSASTLSCMMSHLLPAAEIRPPTHVRMDTARVCAGCPQQSTDCTVPYPRSLASQPASQGYPYYSTADDP